MFKHQLVELDSFIAPAATAKLLKMVIQSRQYVDSDEKQRKILFTYVAMRRTILSLCTSLNYKLRFILPLNSQNHFFLIESKIKAKTSISFLVRQFDHERNKPTDVFIITLIKYSEINLRYLYRNIMGICYEDSKCLHFPRARMATKATKQDGNKEQNVIWNPEIILPIFMKNYPFSPLLLLD